MSLYLWAYVSNENWSRLYETKRDESTFLKMTESETETRLHHEIAARPRRDRDSRTQKSRDRDESVSLVTL